MAAFRCCTRWATECLRKWPIWPQAGGHSAEFNSISEFASITGGPRPPQRIKTLKPKSSMGLKLQPLLTAANVKYLRLSWCKQDPNARPSSTGSTAFCRFFYSHISHSSIATFFDMYVEFFLDQISHGINTKSCNIKKGRCCCLKWLPPRVALIFLD